MASDDFEVVEYKVLAYLYQSIRDGVKPSAAKAQQVAKVHPVYWDAVISDLSDRGLVKANAVRMFDSTSYGDVRITSAGVDYLGESPKMRKAKEFLGAAFGTVLHIAVEASRAM